MEKRKIEDLLDKFNMPIDNLGYRYLITALEIYMKDINIKITSIYKEVAEIHNTTASRVERAIRHSTECIERNVKQYFNVDYDITNRRFLALLAREMERKQWL